MAITCPAYLTTGETLEKVCRLFGRHAGAIIANDNSGLFAGLDQ